MSEVELMEIALRFFNKGYNDCGQLKDSDDLYNATWEERDMCCDYLDDIRRLGTVSFAEQIEMLK